MIVFYRCKSCGKEFSFVNEMTKEQGLKTLCCPFCYAPKQKLQYLRDSGRSKPKHKVLTEDKKQSDFSYIMQDVLV